jgi:hypothetical protein
VLDREIEKRSRKINFFNKKPFEEKNERFAEVSPKFNSTGPIGSKQDKLDRIKEKLQLAETQDCTFVPSINKTSSQIVENSNYVPVQKRPLLKARKEEREVQAVPKETKKLDPDFYRNQFEWKQALQKQYESEKKHREESELKNASFTPLNTQQMRQQYVMDRTLKLEETKRTQELRIGGYKRAAGDGNSPRNEGPPLKAEQSAVDTISDIEDNNPFKQNENDFKSEGRLLEAGEHIEVEIVPRRIQQGETKVKAIPIDIPQEIEKISVHSQDPVVDDPAELAVQEGAAIIPEEIEPAIDHTEENLIEFESFAPPSLTQVATPSQEQIYNDYITGKLEIIMAAGDSHKSIRESLRESSHQANPQMVQEARQSQPDTPEKLPLSGVPQKDQNENQLHLPVLGGVGETPTFQLAKSEREEGIWENGIPSVPLSNQRLSKAATPIEATSDVHIQELEGIEASHKQRSDQEVNPVEVREDEDRELRLQSRQLWEMDAPEAKEDADFA